MIDEPGQPVLRLLALLPRRLRHRRGGACVRAAPLELRLPGCLAQPREQLVVLFGDGEDAALPQRARGLILVPRRMGEVGLEQRQGCPVATFDISFTLVRARKTQR